MGEEAGEREFGRETADNESEAECHELQHFMQLVSYDDLTSYTEIRIIYCCVYISIFVIGVVGNGLLINSIILRRRFTVANVFLLNLAASDLLLCITAVPITPVLALYKKWFFGQLLCKLVPACQAVSVVVSTYCLCFIALDRYTSIVTPTKEPWSISRSQCLMALTWMLAALISSPLYIMQNLQAMSILDDLGHTHLLCGQFCGEFLWPESSPLKLFYGTGLLLLQFAIPSVIISFCYWKILQKVRTDWIVAEGSMLTAAQQAATAVRKRRVVYVLILMVVIFMASWLPLTLANFLRDLGYIFEQSYFKMLNVHAIAMSSIVWNPLLYFWLSKRHRRALRDDMFWLTAARRQPGLLSRFAPSPSVSFVYKRTLQRHLAGGRHFRRGTLADPTNMERERRPSCSMAAETAQPACFLLVPLMPLCQSLSPSPSPSSHNGSSLISSRTRNTLLPPTRDQNGNSNSMRLRKPD